MPDATITSTASTFGTISGVFSSDQSTITGTITGVVVGTLDGSVGVPGPQGPTGPQGPAGAAGQGVPAGGTAGQFLTKIDGTNYNTDWTTLDVSGYRSLTDFDFTNVADEKLETFGLTLAQSNAGITTVSALDYQGLELQYDSSNSGTVEGTEGYSYLNTGALYNAIQTWTLVDGDLVTTGPSGFYLTSAGLTFNTSGTTPASGSVQYLRTSIVFGDSTTQTTAFPGFNNAALTGNPTAPTAAFGDNDTSIATTAFVQAGLLGGTANARNLEVYVRNQSGSTIPAGSIVYISGATGNRPLITLAQANNDANSAQTIGFVKTSIANNAFGYVIVRGELENIDTSALAEGVQLYLSPTTAGTWTTTKPSAPQHLVYVGIVVRSHPTLGVILVAVQNGYELDELHDVAIGTLANNDLLAYESSTDLWKNKTYSALGLATESWVTSQGYLTSATAASTYQTISGMSSYLTTSAAASSYYPLTGNPSGFLTSAPVTSVAGRTGAITLSTSDISGLGTMATASASDYSTTTAANLLYYPLSSNPAGYITSAPVTSVAGRTGAITLAVADVSGAAPTDSPTFSGTPSLPTGTTAVTQSPGNNTTALATTAFVTAAVPAFATIPESLTGSSNTVTISPLSNYIGSLNPAFYPPSVAQLSSTVTGTGSSSSANANGYSIQLGSTAGAYATRSQTLWPNRVAVTGNLQWTRPVGFGARIAVFNRMDSTAQFGISFGQATATLATPTVRSIGCYFAATALNTPGVLVLEVHDGTNYNTVNSSFTPTFNQLFDVECYSDGNGNAYLYVNGSQVATSANAPSTNGGTTYQTVLQVGYRTNGTPTGTSNSVFQCLKFLTN